MKNSNKKWYYAEVYGSTTITYYYRFRTAELRDYFCKEHNSTPRLIPISDSELQRAVRVSAEYAGDQSFWIPKTLFYKDKAHTIQLLVP